MDVNISFKKLAPLLLEVLQNCPRTASVLPVLTALYAPLVTPSLNTPRVDHYVWARCFTAIHIFVNKVSAALTLSAEERHARLHASHQEGVALFSILDNIGFFSSFTPSLPRSYLLDQLIAFMPSASPDVSMSQEFVGKMHFADQLLRSTYTVYTTLFHLFRQPPSNNIDFAASVSAGMSEPIPPAHDWVHPRHGAVAYSQVLTSAATFMQRLNDAGARPETKNRVSAFFTTLVGLRDFPMESLLTATRGRLELVPIQSSDVPPPPIYVNAMREFRHMCQESLKWTTRVLLVCIPVTQMHTTLFATFRHCVLVLRGVEHPNLVTIHGSYWPLPKPSSLDPSTWAISPMRSDRSGLPRNAFLVIERTSCDLFEAIKQPALRSADTRLRILVDTLKGLQALHLQGFFHPALTPAAVRINVSGQTGFTGFAKLDHTSILHDALFPSGNNLIPLSSAIFLPPETLLNVTTSPHLLSNMWSFALIACFLLAEPTGRQHIPPFQLGNKRDVAVAWLARIQSAPIRNALRPCFNINPDDRPTTAHVLPALEGILTQLTSRAAVTAHRNHAATLPQGASTPGQLAPSVATLTPAPAPSSATTVAPPPTAQPLATLTRPLAQTAQVVAVASPPTNPLPVTVPIPPVARSSTALTSSVSPTTVNLSQPQPSSQISIINPSNAPPTFAPTPAAPTSQVPLLHNPDMQPQPASGNLALPMSRTTARYTPNQRRTLPIAIPTVTAAAAQAPTPTTSGAPALPGRTEPKSTTVASYVPAPASVPMPEVGAAPALGTAPKAATIRVPTPNVLSVPLPTLTQNQVPKTLEIQPYRDVSSAVDVTGAQDNTLSSTLEETVQREEGSHVYIQQNVGTSPRNGVAPSVGNDCGKPLAPNPPDASDPVSLGQPQKVLASTSDVVVPPPKVNEPSQLDGTRTNREDTQDATTSKTPQIGENPAVTLPSENSENKDVRIESNSQNRNVSRADSEGRDRIPEPMNRTSDVEVPGIAQEDAQTANPKTNDSDSTKLSPPTPRREPLPDKATSKEVLLGLLNTLDLTPDGDRSGAKNFDHHQAIPKVKENEMLDKNNVSSTNSQDGVTLKSPSATKSDVAASASIDQILKSNSGSVLQCPSNQSKEPSKRGESTTSSDSFILVKPSKKKRERHTRTPPIVEDSSSSSFDPQSVRKSRGRFKRRRILEDSGSSDPGELGENSRPMRSLRNTESEIFENKEDESHSRRRGTQVKRSAARKNYKEESSNDEIESELSSGSLERPFRNQAQTKRKHDSRSDPAPKSSPQPKTENAVQSSDSEASRDVSSHLKEDVAETINRRSSKRLRNKPKGIRDNKKEGEAIPTSNSIPKQSKNESQIPLAPDDEVVKANDGYTYSPQDEAKYELIRFGKDFLCNQQNPESFYEQSVLASHQGNPEASLAVGLCLMVGTGTPKNEVKGATVLLHASRYKQPDALYCAGLCLEDGVGVAKDEAGALQLYKRAKETSKHVSSIYRIGLLLKTGRGIKRSFSDAALHFDEGAKQGHVPSKVKLANCFAKHGQGVRRNLHKAVALYKEAEKNGSAEAILKLGLLFEDGEGVPKDPKKALDRYKRAAKLGYAPGETALGQCYRWGYGIEQDLGKALDYFHRASEKKHDLAIFELGQMHRLGVGVDRSYERAAQLYRKAIVTNLPVAIVAYGEMLYFGTGVERDYDEAFRYFQLAADLGAEEGHRWLGDCYIDGSGVKKDVERGFKCFQKGAELGSVVAHTSIGQCYEKGTGVKPSLPRAYNHYSRAAKAGDPTGYMNLGIFYEQGRHVKQNFEKAVEYYTLGIDHGSTEALCHLADCYAAGRGVKQDMKKAVDLYQRGADHNMADAQCELGLCYYLGKGVKQDYAKAVDLFRLSSQSESEAIRLLGTAHFEGHGVPQDFGQAVVLFTKASEKGNSEAKVDLGRCYRDGKGVSRDATKAAKLFEEAANHPYDNKVAMMEIGNMYHEGAGVKQDFDIAFKWLSAGNGEKNNEKDSESQA